MSKSLREPFKVTSRSLVQFLSIAYLKSFIARRQGAKLLFAFLSMVGFIYTFWFFFLSKAELPKVGIFFALNFLPWEFLLIKKLEIEKTKTT